MKRVIFLIGAAAIVTAWSAVVTSALALEPREQRGLVFARANCAMCHAIGASGASPLPMAPPFRRLHERYPVDSLGEALAEGIVTGHPSMPQFQLDRAQIGDLLAYLHTLER
ncbi:c-type cytochrome [Hansschlegelia sp. KR7-227]|uniref:c-type cytochrome n=1 Tax=Hansschlegelia sp. KR7-227 TaxID=3400914 RepID=UPI003BFB0A23